MIVAPMAHMTDVKKACWSPELSSAAENHSSVNPDGGQALVPLLLKAYRTTIVSGR